MTVTAIESYSDFTKVINSGKPVIIDFWASWCGPCKAMSPIFDKFSEVFPAVEFYKVNTDEQEQISAECGIRAMPCFTLFKDGQKLKEVLGANPVGLQQLIQSAI